MTVRALVATLIVIYALMAAVCWFMAATAKVSNEKAEEWRVAAAKERGEPVGPSIGIDGADLAETIALQSRWNQAGAICAGLAAVCQAMYTWLAEFG